MSKLVKGMYADYVCHEFDIRYNQIRTDALVQNAGWFNSKGEKLGFGDLNFNDLDNISMDIENNEVFIVLSEADSTWDMPDGLDRNEPGAPYVMQHAKWVISGLEKTEAYIWHVLPESRMHPLEVNPISKDGAEQYYECTRFHLFTATEFDGKKFLSIKPTPTTAILRTGYYYGLDQHELTDGTIWAVGNWTQVQNAGLKKAEEYVPAYVMDNSLIDKLGAELTRTQRDIIQLVAAHYPTHGLSSIKKLMTEKCLENFCKHIFASKGSYAILSIDEIERMAYEIKGLPNNNNLYAFKVM